MDKILPIIYTPVVIKACKNFKSVVYYSPETEIGLTLNIKDHKDTIEDILNEWQVNLNISEDSILKLFIEISSKKEEIRCLLHVIL